MLSIRFKKEMQKSAKKQKRAKVKKMRADGAHLFRYLFLKKLKSRAHFDQITENLFCIETSKMNILSYVSWCLRCGNDAHGSCASFPHLKWVIALKFGR